MGFNAPMADTVSIHDHAGLRALFPAHKRGDYLYSRVLNRFYQRLDDDPGACPELDAELAARLRQTVRTIFLTQRQRLDDTAGTTTRLLLACDDGAAIETVIIRHAGSRNSVCISSQVGCSLDCSFCSTARLGFRRNLSSDEILDQVHRAAVLLAAEGRRLRNVLFMGMGEPLLNYAALARVIPVLVQNQCYSLARHQITVSTAGIAKAMYQFARDFPGLSLALSLHAANDALRRRLMPRAAHEGLDQVLAAMDAVAAVSRTRVFVEYVLLAGINDSDTDAAALAGLLQGRRVHVNLLPWNPALSPQPEYQAPEYRAVREFQARLRAGGLVCTVRSSRGDEIAAACGQLAGSSGEAIRT